MEFKRESCLLSDVASFQEGYVNPPQSDPTFFDGEIKWLRAVDLNNGKVRDTSRKLTEKGFRSAGKSATLFQPGTLAISKSGTIGRLGILEDFMCGNRAVINIRLRDSVDSRFVFYSLLLKRAEIEVLAEGSVQKNLYVSALGRLSLEFPPLSTQKEVGALLGSIDNRIDNLQQTNATLEAIAQALFKSWFVDFDPVRAKAEGREPEGMDAAIAALFPDSFENSELGPIPVGWRVETFSSAFEFTMGQSPPGSTYNTDGAGTAFFQGCTDFGDVFPARRVFTTAPSRLARTGDVLMSVRAPVGAVNIAASNCAIGRGLCAIRHKSGSTGLTIEFVKASVQRIEAAAGEGALFKSLSKRQLADLPVASAGDALVTAAIELLDPIVERRLLLARQAEVLTQLRDTLLPRLISGRIRLPEAEAVVEDLSA